MGLLTLFIERYNYFISEYSIFLEIYISPRNHIRLNNGLRTCWASAAEKNFSV